MRRRDLADEGSTRLRCAALVLVLCAGCGSAEVDAGLEEVPAGSELNYYSTDAIEYLFEGQSFVEIEPELVSVSEEAKLARARQLIGPKTIAIGWFLNIRLSDKSLTSGELGDPNRETYPGFHAIVRTGDWTLSNLHATGDGRRYAYTVKLQAAGPPDLLAKLPGTALPGGKKSISLAMGKLSNEDLMRTDSGDQWFRDDPWRTRVFDPTRMPADRLEQVPLVVSPEPRSSDAYLDLGKLYADGRLTIDAHYGYDYLDGYDISNSASLYHLLEGQGFSSPADRFETYEAKMGPMTRRFSIGGRQVEVAVRIFHGASQGLPGPALDTDEGGTEMANNMFDSLAHSDVIVFSGHSGQYYGFALANWRRTLAGHLEYPELSSAEMPTDRYQIVLASGCETFSIGQAFSENPSKPGLRNLNVITTNGFANAGSNKEVVALLAALYGDDAAGFDPQPISTMLSAMNRFSAMDEMFGLHGIDRNPRLHPFARVEALGRGCTVDTDCGSAGNHCTRSGGAKVCSATCLDDSACPSPYRCRVVATSNASTLAGRQCLR